GNVICTRSVYFIGCLRLQYFKEWEYSAEVNKAYKVVARYNHTRCVRDVYASWYYDGALEFYRVASGQENIWPFYRRCASRAGEAALRFELCLRERLFGCEQSEGDLSRGLDRYRGGCFAGTG